VHTSRLVASGVLLGLVMLIAPRPTAAPIGWPESSGGHLDGSGPEGGSLWYVANEGDDANPGSQDLPFRTIQRAVDAAASGDSVILLSDAYSGPGNVNVTWQDRDLSFASLSGNRDNCVIECAGAPGFVYTVAVAGVEHRLSFRGLTIHGATTAISAAALPRWEGGLPVLVDVTDCRLSDGAGGIEVACGSVALRGTAVRGFTSYGVDLYLANQIALDDCVLRNNGVGLSFYQYSDGYHVEVDSTDFVSNGIGIGYWQESAGMALTNCRVDSSTVSDGIQTASDWEPLLIENCIVEGNARHGVAIIRNTALQVVASRISGNGRHGIAYWGSDPVSLTNVSLIGNRAWGICADNLTAVALMAKYLPVTSHKRRGPFSQRLEMRDCDVRGNLLGGLNISAWDGGSMWGGLDPNIIEDTIIVDNSGPGILLAPHSPRFVWNLARTTVAGNAGPGIAAVACAWTATQTLISGNQGPGIDLTGGASVELACCDLFGNGGGDWIGEIAGQSGSSGNIAADPRFCDPAAGNYTVLDTSPCLPGHHPDAADCGRIGARGVGCSGPVANYVSHLSAIAEPGRCVITWQVGEALRPEDFRVWRSVGGSGFATLAMDAPVLAGGQWMLADCEVESGRDYAYRVFFTRGLTATLLFETSRLQVPEMLLRLCQNAPNPFNPRTAIRFDLPVAGTVRLAVYDVAGRLVRTLVDGDLPNGTHEAVWDGRDATARAMASGGYLARLEAGGQVRTVRMSLVQ
jgi:hypothetical protein